MTRGSVRPIFACLLLGLAASPARAQFSVGDLRMVAFSGPAFFAGAVSRPFEMGLSADATVFHPWGGRVGAGVLVEGGLFHPAISGTGNYYFSADAMLDQMQPERAIAAMKVRPFAIAGYTGLFNASATAINPVRAVNFGVGLDRMVNEELSVRLEVRDMYRPGINFHALVFRIGLVGITSVQ